MTRVLAYAPALLVTAGLFGAGVLLALVQSLGGLPVTGEPRWSTHAYAQVIGSPAFWSALSMTAWVSLAGTLLAGVLGTLAALALWSTGAGAWLRFLFAWNLAVPHVVAAWVTALLLSQSGLLSRLTSLTGATEGPGDFPALVNDPRAVGVILELAWKETPFVGISVLAALSRFDLRLLDVARSLGASRPARVWQVIVPSVRPALLSSGMLVFAFAFSSFEVFSLLGPTSPATLPVLAYRAFTDTDLASRQGALALSVIIAVLGGLVVVAWTRWSVAVLERDS